MVRSMAKNRAKAPPKIATLSPKSNRTAHRFGFTTDDKRDRAEHVPMAVERSVVGKNSTV